MEEETKAAVNCQWNSGTIHRISLLIGGEFWTLEGPSSTTLEKLELVGESIVLMSKRSKQEEGLEKIPDGIEE